MRKTVDPRRLARWLRIGVLAAFVILAYMLLSRFHLWTMNELNDSMVPAYPPGSKLLVDYRPRPLRIRDVVLYEYEGKGRTARVAALGGDSLEVREGILYVEGHRSPHRVEDPARLPVRVPPGHLLLLNDNPRSRLPDSLVHGTLPASRVRGRVLAALDFL